ncbi:hypothetical protein [Ralstonia pickettii]|uniref:hypothetical protein n=1 Tax=Ralstonia pickettii TaxID=329 RepID=UPI000818AF57|nr:hypothetical protein [Ralstonia pickettii]OCS43688.1 hypothetical protein BEK67_01030 [Ralstonia pickettii]
MFMDELRRLSGEEQGLVPNLRLRDSLGWDEVRYKSVKSRLNGEGLLVIGRGHGGSVGLARPEEGDALKVFVSYSHVDEKLKDAVMSHLRPLERLKLIAQWNDRKLLAGDKWEQEISANL